jgi:hypothetical protein
MSSISSSVDMNILHDELRRMAMEKRRVSNDMFDYPKPERFVNVHEEIKSKASREYSWAQTILDANAQDNLSHVLYELKKEKKKKKKARQLLPKNEDFHDEFIKLQDELKLRAKNKNIEKTSLYKSLGGGFDGESKARLEITKKDILDEIRKKSSNRRKTGKVLDDDYGLLGSTKSKVLDELKKKSKKKKRSSGVLLSDSRRPSLTSDGQHDITFRPATPPRARNPREDNANTPRSRSDDDFDLFDDPRRMVDRRSPKWDDSRFGNESYQKDFLHNESDLEDVSESCGRKDDFSESLGYRKGSIGISYGTAQDNPQTSRVRCPYDNYASPIPQNVKESLHSELKKVSLHSELKRQFKAPSRSRSLMYKYGNYDDSSLSESRSSLHEELQTRVSRVPPRIYSSSSLGIDKSIIHDELKSRYIASRSMSLSKAAYVKRSSSSLNDHIRERKRLDGSRRGILDKSKSGGYYIPGITTNKSRFWEETDETVETQETSDTEHDASASRYFIPGITGIARCLDRSDPLDSSHSDRRSVLSSTSGGLDNSSASKFSSRSLDMRSRGNSRNASHPADSDEYAAFSSRSFNPRSRSSANTERQSRPFSETDALEKVSRDRKQGSLSPKLDFNRREG